MLRIGGWLKYSLIDYPGKIAAVVFTQGCNFRCRYCYNRELVLPSHFKDPIPEDEVLAFLHRRRGLLQGVVISGGEPTLQSGLLEFIRKIKKMGFAIKLDTNGSRPDVLAKLLAEKLLNYVAMDVKAPFYKYEEVINAPVRKSDLVESIELIIGSGLAHHFRTTALKELLSIPDYDDIHARVQRGKRYVLQNFQPKPTVLDQTLLDKPTYTAAEFSALQRIYEFIA